jgi:hypothetical protein
MATNAIYLHHERSTKATAEADAQNREIVLDKANLAPLGRFNDGTLWHGVTEEKPSVALLALTVTGATALNNTLAVTALSTLAGGAVVTAATDGASKHQVGGSESRKVQALTGNTTLDTTHNTLECDATSGSFVVTLPAAAGCTGRRYAFHKNDASANTVTVDANASETIDGATTVILGGNVGNSHLVIVSNGTNWRIEWLYEEGAFTGTLTGCTTSPTATVYYARTGKKIDLMLPILNATSNSTSCTITGMPTNIRPARQLMVPFKTGLMDNGLCMISTVSSFALIQTSGVIAFGRHLTTNDPFSGRSTTFFTSSGPKGIETGLGGEYIPLSYTIQ